MSIWWNSSKNVWSTRTKRSTSTCNCAIFDRWSMVETKKEVWAKMQVQLKKRMKNDWKENSFFDHLFAWNSSDPFLVFGAKQVSNQTCRTLVDGSRIKTTSWEKKNKIIIALSSTLVWMERKKSLATKGIRIWEVSSQYCRFVKIDFSSECHLLVSFDCLREVLWFIVFFIFTTVNWSLDCSLHLFVLSNSRQHSFTIATLTRHSLFYLNQDNLIIC